ncbi:MAG TPA: maleylpyruvate isomerase family mycothiol-dependent enzyme [Acidimicrobiales bacterium]|nr:maleylpyruvate isomerase family mycothiol-dependent enzyme [Acidimicrobiales bacterium]
MPGPAGIAAGSRAADLTSQLEDVWAELALLGNGMADTEWHAPSPCPGWDVSAQYAHVIGTESMLLGRANPEVDPGKPGHVRNDIGGFNEVWVAALAGCSKGEVLEKFEEVASERAKALKAMTEDDFSAPAWTPVGQADYRRFMQIRVFDCWVHEQDVRDAVGRPGHESGPVAEQSVDEIVRALGFVVGKKAGLPAESTVSFRLVGPVSRAIDVAVVDGRAKVVSSLDTPATVTLSLSSSALCRLGCGRVSPESVLDGALGGVKMSGDAELGRRVVSNLAFTI